MEESSDDRLRFVRAIGEVMKAVAIDCQRNEDIDPGMYIETLKEAFTEFASITRDTVIPEEDDMESGVLAEIDREHRFFQELAGFAQEFKDAGLSFKIMSTTSGYTPGIYRNIAWNTGIAPQCEIAIGPTKNYIAAFPAGPAMAVVKPDVHPATPIYSSPSCILLFPYDEDLDAPTWEAFKGIFGEVEPVDIGLSGTANAKKGRGFLAFDSDEALYGTEMEQLFNDFEAHALFITISAENTTTLHLKTTKELSSGPMRLHYWAFPIFAMQAHGF